ncbi:2546_t:CDS:2 [Scutellospora calospora]|uniref:2546_t:CDS:1 n=1 Tax=Scutellospora calospora TaxID=85575 RepID=A0ACA9K1K4_9GLOM|nr:2546_t:CDS:2 [Scutellospora calospora]
MTTNLILEKSIILPGAIIADSYASATFLFYACKGTYGNDNEYFGKDYLNHWNGIFQNTPTDDTYQRSLLEQIGSYSSALLEVLFAYEGWNNLNYSTEEFKSPAKLKYSTLSSVIISFILYFLTNVAFITVVNPKDAINSNDPMAINFGRILLGEPGRILISILISISALGCVGSLVFMGSRVITYAAQTGFMPYSHKLYIWHPTFDTPLNALSLQFVYCAILILLFPAGSTDSNLSKNNLEDICRNLGLPTEGVKADLVQRLKIHSARVLASPVLLDSTNDIMVEGDYVDDDENTHMTREKNYETDLELDEESTPIQTLRERALKTRYNNIAKSSVAHQSTTELNSM